MAAPSMAAALAASLPSQAPAPAPAATNYDSIPQWMSKVIDIEAEIPLTSVQLDGMVVTKIIKHGREAVSGTARGLLLGLDLDGTIEVSNSFALPNVTAEDDEKAAKEATRYQVKMLRALNQVQSDDSIVGFYQATALGAFLNQSLLETQAAHQEKLRHGGIVVIHDLSQTALGSTSFRAFRLRQEFLRAFKAGTLNATSLINNKITFSTILEELPVKIRTNPLLSSFVNMLSDYSTPSYLSTTTPSSPPHTSLPPSFSALDLGTTGMSRNLEQIVDALDAYRTEEGNLAYLQRQIAREKSRADQYVAKRKEENATRVAQGLAPFPEEDVSRLFKIPPEPSRLESMLLLGQVDAYAKSLAGTAGVGLVKMYAAKASSGV